MDTRDTIEIAALLAAHADVVVESPDPLDRDAVRRTWQWNQDRVTGWLQRLRNAAESTADEGVDDVLDIAREVLLTDVLARVWSGLLLARSRRTGALDLEAVARNVLLGRMRARRIVLEWLLDDPRTLAPAVDGRLAAVDRLRRRAERWTDLLLANLARRFDLPDCGFDPERLRDFAESNGPRPVSGHWPLVTTGLRLAFDDVPPDGEAAGLENARDVRSILACLPCDAFEHDGPLRTLRYVRIRRNDPLPGDREPNRYSKSRG